MAESVGAKVTAVDSIATLLLCLLYRVARQCRDVCGNCVACTVRCSRDKNAGRGPGYAVARWAAVLGRQSGFDHKAEK